MPVSKGRRRPAAERLPLTDALLRIATPAERGIIQFAVNARFSVYNVAGVISLGDEKPSERQRFDNAERRLVEVLHRAIRDGRKATAIRNGERGPFELKMLLDRETYIDWLHGDVNAPEIGNRPPLKAEAIEIEMPVTRASQDEVTAWMRMRAECELREHKAKLKLGKDKAVVRECTRETGCTWKMAEEAYRQLPTHLRYGHGRR